MTFTKIISTLGPASATKEQMMELIKAGVDIFRVNMSHGNHDFAGELIKNARAAAAEMKVNIPLFMDLRGPKLRIGAIDNGEVMLADGQPFMITTRRIQGSKEAVSTDYYHLPGDVRPGFTILLDDGQLVLKVVRVAGDDVHCQVEVGGLLKSNKGMALPGVHAKIPALTDKDINDVKFGIEMAVDGFMLSFVQHREDILELHGVMRACGKLLPVISKIETASALTNLDSIAEGSEALLVARGDLGVELPMSKLPVAQKEIIAAAHRRRKPAIVATEMLESMVSKNRPTRAEVTDVAHAVFDGADAVMLSAETATGKYPVKAVQTMDAIAAEAEKHLPEEFKEIAKQEGVMVLPEGLCYSARRLASSIGAQAIIAYTISGFTARILSYFCPDVPVYAFTGDTHTARILNIYRGTEGQVLETDPETFDEFIDTAISMLRDEGKLVAGKSIVAVNVSSASTNRRHANAVRVIMV